MSVGATFTPIIVGDPSPPRQQLWDRRRYIHFFGEAFGNAGFNFSFDVLSGEQPPTIVDGYAQWQVVARPLRVGLMVFTGRNPISMQVAVRFMLFDQHGSWLTDDASGLAIEDQIRILGWMAGEGIDVGPSPLVWLTTYDSGGDTIPLIPFELQGATPNVPKLFSGGDHAPWVVTGLTWDPAPIRTANDYRIRQDATVTLALYNAPEGQGTSNLPRAKAITVISTAGADTALEIARDLPSNNPPLLANGIIGAPQNKRLALRSVNQPIKHGKRVFVPSSANS